MKQNQIHALLSLDVPFLDGLDIKTIAQVKEEYQDEFQSFSRAVFDSVRDIKAAFGTEGFIAETRHIQRNLIDSALADVTKTVNKVTKSKALRRAGMLTGLIGLNGAALFGAPEATLIAGLGSSGAALVLEKLAQLKEDSEIKESNGYFLWKLQHSVK